MYNKKYVLEKIEEFNGYNPLYDGAEGQIAYPAYFNVGERGWFILIENGWFREYGHRIHTSIVQDVEYLEDHIIVTTQNTKFTFTVVGN